MVNSPNFVPAFKLGTALQSAKPEEEQHLLIEISNSTVTLAIYGETQHKVAALEHFIFPEHQEQYHSLLEDFFLTHHWFRKNYRAVWISFSSNEAMLYPEELHDTMIQEQALELLTGDLSEGEVVNDLIQKAGVACVYRIPTILYNLIGSRFGEESATHLYALLPRYHAIVSNPDIMEVAVGNKQMTVFLRKKGKLMLVQQYPCLNGAEAAYHLLHIKQQFGLDVETFPVQLSGMIDPDSALEKEISRYFRNVSFAMLPTDLQLSEDFFELPTHYFHNIYKLAACVSLAED